MEAGLAFLPDRVRDPAALAGEVLLTGLFGPPTSDGSDNEGDERERDDGDDGDNGGKGNEGDAETTDPAGPRTVYELGAARTPVVALPVRARGIAFQLWPSALALCRHLELAVADGSLDLAHLRCLELGAGLGTVGIAAAILGAPKVYVSDLLAVCEHMEANVLANPPSLGEASALDDPVPAAVPAAEPSSSGAALPSASTARYGAQWALAQRAHTVPLALPWGADGAPVTATLRDRVDLILASDVVYWEHLHAPLLETLVQLTEGPAPPPVIMAHLRRRRADKTFFKTAARWFTVAVIDQQSVPTYRSFIQIYRFTRRAPSAPQGRSERAAAAHGQSGGQGRPEGAASAHGQSGGQGRPERAAAAQGQSGGQGRPERAAAAHGQSGGQGRPEGAAAAHGQSNGQDQPEGAAAAHGQSGGQDRPELSASAPPPASTA